MRWRAIVPALALVLTLGMSSAAPVAATNSALAQQSQVGLTVSSYINPVYLGSFLTIRFQVRNNHSAQLYMGVRVSIPAGLTVVGTYPDCPALASGCTIGWVQPGSIANQEVNVRVNAVIDATASGTVTGSSVCVPRLGLASGPFGRGKAGALGHTMSAAAQCAPTYSNTGSGRIVTFASPIVLAIAVAPQPGVVGGDPVTATYTIRNIDDSALSGVTLNPGLPAGWVPPSGCAPPPQPCAVGTIPRSGSATRTYTLSPGTPGSTPINATATGTYDSCNDGCMRTATATAVSQVVIAAQPVLTLTPAIGPPGFVTTAVGTGFPEGATVKLTWSGPAGQPLLTENLTLTVAGGGFTTQVLVFRRDQLGERTLVAEWAAGPRFNPATATFLVVPNTWTPPLPIRD